MGLGESGWGLHGCLVVGFWIVALTALAVRAYQHDTRRAA